MKQEMINPCPNCGSYFAESTGNIESYPDHYEKWYCDKCNFLVGMIDNSAFVHASEFENNNYKIEI